MKEKLQPFFQVFPRHHFSSMFPGIDIAVAAGKVTGRQDMHEDIPLTGLESYGLCLKPFHLRFSALIWERV
jgi:hypothetical protein